MNTKYFAKRLKQQGSTYCLAALVALGMTTAASPIALADEAPFAQATNGPATTETYNPAPSKYLLGDWGGKRTRLEEQGVTFDGHYVVDALSNVSGGMDQANTAWGRIRLTTDLDLGKLLQWKGASVHVTGLWQYGANLGSQYIGAIANPSSLVSAHTLRMDSFWLEQQLLAGRLVLRAGQIGGQDFYGVREYGASFLAEPMGYAFGNLFGNVYESFDPASTPAAEIRVVPTQNFYVKTAVLSGNRNPFGDDNSGLNFSIRNAPVWAAETGFLLHPPAAPAATKTLGVEPGPHKPGLAGTYKIGSLYNAGKFTDPRTGTRSGGNYLVYGEASQAVFRQGNIGRDAGRGLDLTFGVSGSPEDVNKLHLQWTAGGRYIGAIAKRPLDEINLGFIQSRLSSRFDTAATTTTAALSYSSEELIELNYRALLRPWLVFQPDFQYTVNPGALKDASRDNAVVFGFRTKVTF